MGSGGGNTGGGADSKPTRSGDFIRGKAAGMRTDSSRALPGAKKREEERLRRSAFMTGDASYVRGGGDIVRDSSGAGVLTGVGIQRAEASRQEELETVIAARAVPTVEPDGTITTRQDPAAEKRKMAIEALEERKENTLPGFLGAISRINIENQIKQLKEGTADPQFALTEGGSFAPRGVTSVDDDTVGGNIAPMFPDRGEQDEPEPQQPIIDEEIVEETILGRGRGRGAATKRRTRGTRLGGAGSLEEGYGVLLRNQ